MLKWRAQGGMLESDGPLGIGPFLLIAPVGSAVFHLRSKYNTMQGEDPKPPDIDALISRCRAESQQALDTHVWDSNTSCYELFRRAVEEGIPEAWDAVYDQYHRLVLFWIGPDLPDAEEVVNRAFAKFWQFCPRESFSKRFSTLRHVLSYLRRCAISARQEVLRSKRLPRQESDLATQGFSSRELVEKEALDNVVQQRFKELVWERLKNDRERLIMHLSYEIGLMPSEIYIRFPQEFSSVDEIRRIKECILKRLRRDMGLQTWWEEAG